MSKAREAVCSMCAFHDVDSGELVDEHKLTYAELLLYSMYLVLNDMPQIFEAVSSKPIPNMTSCSLRAWRMRLILMSVRLDWGS